MEAPAPEIQPREVWATDRPALAAHAIEEVRFLLVHHSASANNYSTEEVPSILRGFYDYHTGPDKRWNDIAYNYLIDRFGEYGKAAPAQSPDRSLGTPPGVTKVSPSSSV